MAPHLRFGIEGELLLARAGTFEPLWHDQLDFGELNALLETIPTDDIPREGLRREGPHPSILPYVVEGYDVPSATDATRILDRLPKGLEIRTPVCPSLPAVLEIYAVLFERLKAALEARGLVPVHVSHHPLETRFAEPGTPRPAYWRWQLAAMTTYGPDLNIGLDADSFGALDLTGVEGRFNYYAPAMVAFSLDAPIYGGKPWVPKGSSGIGKSVRTYVRSLYAPVIMILPEEDWRIEFKAFDTTHSLMDLANDLLLFATVLLSGDLVGSAAEEERVRDLRRIAVSGWRAPGIRDRAEELLEAARASLPALGLDPTPLADYWQRLHFEWLPADETIALFEAEASIAAVLSRSSELVAHGARRAATAGGRRRARPHAAPAVRAGLGEEVTSGTEREALPAGA